MHDGMAAPSRAEPPAPPPLSAAEHVRRLAEAGRVEEARRYVQEHLSGGDADLERWSQLLRPPLAKTSPRRSRGDFGADNAWLRENRDAFLGRWVALRDGKLLDSDATLRLLLDRLTASGSEDGAFIVRVD